MAHEISGSTRPFFSGRALGSLTDLGRISPYEFDDGTTRSLPEQILYHHFVGTHYEWLFMGSFWDRLQTASLNITNTDGWQIPQIHALSPKVRAFVSIINDIIRLTQLEDLPASIALNVHVYYDAHVPLMCAIEDAKTTDIMSLFHKYAPKTTSVIQESCLPDIITNTSNVHSGMKTRLK
jgi:hypothetical protein